MSDTSQQSRQQSESTIVQPVNTQAANAPTTTPQNATRSDAVSQDAASQNKTQNHRHNNQPNSDQPNSSIQSRNKSHRGLVIGIVAAAVVVIVAAALLVPNVVGKASAESVEECNLQLQALSAHQEALKTTEESAKAASKFTDKDVADASTLKDLTAAQKEVDELGDAPTCPANGSQSKVDEATNQIRDYAENLRSATSVLDAAAKAAIASHEELTGAEE